MMDDIRERLKFPDIGVRARCIKKLYQSVKKKTGRKIISSSSVQIPELDLLWEIMIDPCTTNSRLAAQAIVLLVKESCIDLKYGLNRLLSFISTSRNVYAVVKAITKLLIHQHSQLKENEKSNYCMKYPKHPLITVLQSNDDFLPLVLENLSDTICECNIQGFQVMEPVICYILCNPVQHRQNDYTKVLLLESLIEIIKTERKAAIFILRCLPLLQVETIDQVKETSSFILKAKSAIIELNCDLNEKTYISELLLLALVCTAERCLALGQSANNLLIASMDILYSLNKLDYCSSYANLCIIVVAQALKITSQEEYLKLAMMLLDLKPISPSVAAFLAVSVIQLSSSPPELPLSNKLENTLPKLLIKLDKYLLNYNTQDNSIASTSKEDSDDTEIFPTPDTTLIESFTISSQTALQCAKFASILDHSDLIYKSDWLRAIGDATDCKNSENVDIVFSLVAMLFLTSPNNPEFLNCCLQTLEALLLKHTYLSTKIFALLLYKQGLLQTPECKVLVMQFLPKSATHKFAMSPIISLLQVMSKEKDLRHQSIYLMLQLWKMHGRCFSYLHKMVTDCPTMEIKNGDISVTLLAQTAAIKEICLLEPQKHGSEFLKILSRLIMEFTDDSHAPIAALALEGITHLCKSEVIEIRSTWAAMSSFIIKDKRISVSVRLFEFLSLVPELEVNSVEYDTFLNEIAAFIWKKISSASSLPETVGAAFKSLASFPVGCFKLKQLPSNAKCNLTLPPTMTATPFEMGKSPEDILTYIPGHCFIDLLRSYKSSVIIEGYTEFLNSLVKQEINDLTRNIYGQKRHLQKQEFKGTLDKVPQFLCGQIQARKSPNIQKNIAVGVLLCYEPPIEMGKTGEPIKRSIAQQYRFYEQVLGVLLNEVNIETSEWQRCVLLPSAWSGFMDRGFFTCEESRRAELELQQSLGHLTVSAEEIQILTKSAWLWVRDRLLNIIKTNAKNAPTSHANAVFAISSLLHTVDKFYSGLDDSTKDICNKNDNYTPHQQFVLDCTETILCAAVPDYEPFVQVYSWLLTHLSRPKSSASFLVQGCAASSLSHLVPILVSSHLDKIPMLLRHLVGNLIHDSPVLRLYTSIGLGHLVKSLCDSGFVDLGDDQADLILQTVNDVIKLYKKDGSANCHVTISLALKMSSLTNINNDEFKDCASATCNFLQESLMAEDPSSMSFEMLSICSTAMAISAVAGNCVPLETLLSLASWFETKQLELLQCSGVSVSLGLLIDALQKLRNPRGSEMKDKFQKEWFSVLSSDKKPTLHRIAAFNGICSLYSSGKCLFQIACSDESVDASSLNEIVQFMFQTITASKDNGLQNISSWEVGRLYSVHCFSKDDESAIPNSYSYLKETSILKPLVKFLLESQNEGISATNSLHVFSCLRSLQGPFLKPLPPLNWIMVLTPYMQNVTEPAFIEVCLKISLCEANSSPSANNLLASYCCPPLINTLPEICVQLLWKRIPELSLVLPAAKLKIFLQSVVSTAIKLDEKFCLVGKNVLDGILSAMKQSELKQQSLTVIQQAFVYLLRHLNKNWDLFQERLSWISSVFMILPTKSVENLLSVSENEDNIPALTAVCCILVRNGRKKISSLRPYVEEGKQLQMKSKEQILASIVCCFHTCTLETSEISKPEKSISWFLETVGWMNVVNEQSNSKSNLAMRAKEDFLFLNAVCLATLSGCAGLKANYSLLPRHSVTYQQLFEILPSTVSELVTVPSWSDIADKIVDWLISLLQSQHLNHRERHLVKLSLASVKSTDVFKNLDVWTNVITEIY